SSPPGVAVSESQRDEKRSAAGASAAAGSRRRVAERGPALGALLGALLALTLGLAALLAYEAQQAVRSHRLSAERALRDYAAFAAWELLAKADDAVRVALGSALAPAVAAKAASPYEALTPPDVLAESARDALRCERPADDAGRFYFRIDLRTGALATSGAVPPAATRAWVADTVAAELRRRVGPGTPPAVVVGAGRGAGRAVAFGVKYAPFDAPLAAYGVVTCASALGGPLFRAVMAQHPLLPAAVAGPGVPNDSLLVVRVDDGAGRTLFRSATADATPSPFAATASLDGSATAAAAGLTATAALRPAAAARLLAGRGDAPERSRLPVLVAALALTAALAGVALLQLRREQELARLRAEFTSSVSHELRTPLAQILLFGETLSLGRVRSEEEGRVAAETIVQEARRLIHMVENVLHFARAERRVERLSLEAAPLAPLLRSALGAFAPLAAAARARVRAELDDGVVATVDPRAVRQIVLNLLDNALKYGPAGQLVTVGVRRADDGRSALLWVDDEGPGVADADRERVWAPFERAPRGGHGAASGSGIGLAVVRELVGLMGGRTWIEDAPSPSRGARFVVELPLAADDAVPFDTAALDARRSPVGIPASRYAS
ncbi:MAG TPA: HAMP domain-containing sensor histidine kinase, partial [Gemmatimonadaceae bacterium]|nr:HAMP domain-containing sensor histidine kinase [Gemmatimonadaceae bacterium]